jgi:hypothetical protein
MRCNWVKGDRWVAASGHRSLNAYFDSFPNEDFVRACVEVGEELDVDYSLIRLDSMSDEMYERLRFHFDLFGLGEYWRTEALVEVASRKAAFANYYGQSRNTDSLKKFLKVELDSLRRARGNNHWLVALYAGLLASDSFCRGPYLVDDTRVLDG